MTHYSSRDLISTSTRRFSLFLLFLFHHDSSYKDLHIPSLLLWDIMHSSRLIPHTVTVKPWKPAKLGARLRCIESTQTQQSTVTRALLPRKYTTGRVFFYLSTTAWSCLVPLRRIPASRSPVGRASTWIGLSAAPQLSAVHILEQTDPKPAFHAFQPSIHELRTNAQPFCRVREEEVRVFAVFLPPDQWAKCYLKRVNEGLYGSKFCIYLFWCNFRKVA